MTIVATTTLAWCGATPSTSYSSGSLDTFAQCLTNAGAKMFGLATCGHCQKQKALFGASFAKINYTDCKTNPTACSTFQSVPTWEFKDGTQLVGEQSFATLGAKTSCALPK